MRTKRTGGETRYHYVYDGGLLSAMTVDNHTLYFTYDATGAPMTVTLDGTVYYYLTNIQGDVIAILDANGNRVVAYLYDAWGNPLSLTGSMASTLGALNPLRYRGYVYDTETGLYYLQSRYYNPEIGRFINADSYAATGQGFTGNNMFAYCGNNPIINADSSGEFFNTICGALVGGFISAFTRSENESFVQAFARGAVTGAIAGAGLDICIATGGVGGLVICGALGAGSAILDTVWEAHNTDTEDDVSAGDIIISGTVGAGMNILFGASGRSLTNAIGTSVETVGKAIIDNTMRSITNKAGKVVLNKLALTFAENLISSSIQGSFGKIFTTIGTIMVEAFAE